jgi:hypothetical protein
MYEDEQKAAEARVYATRSVHPGAVRNARIDPPAPSQVRPILAAIETNGQLLNEAHQRLEMLEQTLSPLLRSIPTDGATDKLPPSSSPVMEELESQQRRLSALIIRIQTLTQRVDL